MICIPLYNLVLLPGVTYYFPADYFQELTREKAEEGEDVILLMLRHEKKAEMTSEDFYPVGVAGRIASVSEKGTVGVYVTDRVDLKDLKVENTTISVRIVSRPEVSDLDEKSISERFQAVRKALLQALGKFQWGVMASNYVMRWKSLEEMTASLSYMLSISVEEKYRILEADSYAERFGRMERALYEYMELFLIDVEVKEEQREVNEQLYRESAIRKQIEILQNKLDEMHPEDVSDIRKFEMKIAESGMNETAEAEARKVLGRMKQEGKNGHEYGLLYDYLDFVTSLSWKKEEFAHIDLDAAAEILDKEHFGLDKVKERILQQIAVMELNQRQSGSILLFVGAPGTGKTSIGQSVANALNRKYVRISLGGIRDEAEIRGHRRTYIGAMPGRIMEGIRRSGASNPVVVLDEVDKLARDYSGDPASALLEVLDPEQNSTFTDHYMNVPYDLSDVLFICTANSVDTIPEPLLNRMEVIPFQGYSEQEKIQIARKHLLPRSMEQMGIRKASLRITEDAYHAMIADYTMESGVRGLRKQIDTLCRIAAVKLVRGEQKSITVTPKSLRKYMDRKPIRHEHILEEKDPGVVTGLAWTQSGGDILFIETTLTKGEGKVIITGQLGDVMKESARLAVTLVKKLFPEEAGQFAEHDVHIHVPAGAVPKDGPSAGITLTTALASLVTGKAVDPAIAMTGEVSLRGTVLPIGGLPEKLMAAVRSGIRTVLIPEENVDDLEDVSQEVKSQLKIIPVHKVREVLQKTELISVA